MEVTSSPSSRSPSPTLKTFQCTICLEDVGETDRVVTKCNHVFHASCLFQNNAHGNTCPNCREVIAPIPKKVPKMNEHVAASIVQPIINSFPAEPMTKSIYNTFRDGLQVRSSSTHGPGNGKILPNEYSMLPESIKTNLEADLKFAMAEIGLKTCQDIGRWIKYYNESDSEVFERERSVSPSPEPNESPIPEAQLPYYSDEEETDPEMPDLLNDNGNVINSDEEQENFLENTGQEMVNILNNLINDADNDPWEQGESIDPWPRLSTPSPILPASAPPLLNSEQDSTPPPPPPPPPPTTPPPPTPPQQPTEQEIRSSHNRYQYHQEQQQRWQQQHYQIYLQNQQQYQFNPYGFFHPPTFVIHQAPLWNTPTTTSQSGVNPYYTQTNIADLTYY